MDTPEPILVTSKFTAEELNCQTVEFTARSGDSSKQVKGAFMAESVGSGQLEIHVAVNEPNKTTGTFTRMAFPVSQAMSDEIALHEDQKYARFKICNLVLQIHELGPQ